MHPDIEWNVSAFEAPGLEGVYRGHDDLRRFWRAWLEAWEEIEWDLELEDLPDGRVKALIHQRNKSKGAGIWVDNPPYVQFWTIEDGKATRMEVAWAE